MPENTAKLPKYIHPSELSIQGVTIQGSYLVQSMDRLRQLGTPESKDSVVSFRLKFERNEEGAPVINGEVKTTLNVICQRCAKPMILTLEAHPHLMIFSQESQMTQMPREYDPLVTYNQPVLLMGIIEDELLLAMPMIPKHKTKECRQSLPDYL